MRDWRLSRTAQHPNLCFPMGHPPRPTLLRQPGLIRSGSLDHRVQRQTAKVRLLPFWRWSAPMYRQLFFDDGDCSVVSNNRATLQVIACSESKSRGMASNVTKTKEWHQGGCF